MLTRGMKQLFYICTGPLMWANGSLYRMFRAPRHGVHYVQLGPGQKNYLPGWINVDANMFTGKCDVWADLRNRLPFKDQSITAMYSHHVVEHLPDLKAHFREVFRCLQPGGVYRVGGPHGENAIHRFIQNDISWFSDFPDKRSSIGGKLENFIFCRQEHLTILTQSFLEELLIDAGFTQLQLRAPIKETGYPEIFKPCLNIEWETHEACPHTLIMEAVKPA